MDAQSFEVMVRVHQVLAARPALTDTLDDQLGRLFRRKAGILAVPRIDHEASGADGAMGLSLIHI